MSGRERVSGVGKAKTLDHIQFAALPFRYAEDGRPRVMLLTSRETHRWVIPKGWPIRGLKPREVAAREAFEEAGLVGAIIGKRPIGHFHYEKRITPHFGILCEVRVYPFLVEQQLNDWPEKSERETRWFRPAAACELVDEDGLADIIRHAMKVEAGSRP